MHMCLICISIYIHLCVYLYTYIDTYVCMCYLNMNKLINMKFSVSSFGATTSANKFNSMAKAISPTRINKYTYDRFLDMWIR